MDTRILVAFNDSPSGRNLIEFLAQWPFHREWVSMVLFHALAEPATGEQLMGRRYMRNRRNVLAAAMERAKARLVQSGYADSSIAIEIKETGHEPVSSAIEDRLRASPFQLVAIGRKRMSKAEEFVLGDPGTRLVRLLTGSAVLVVTV